MLRIATFSALLLATIGLGHAQNWLNPSRDFVLTSKDAVGMLLARAVCPGHVESISWSADGLYLLVDRVDESPIEDNMLGHLLRKPEISIELNPKHQLVFYSRKSGKVKSTVDCDASLSTTQSLDWIPGSSVVALNYIVPVRNDQNVITGTQSIAEFVGADGNVRTIVRVDDAVSLQVFVSPSKPTVAILECSYNYVSIGNSASGIAHSEMKGRLSFYSPSGRLVGQTTLPIDFSNFSWGGDGRAYIETLDKKKTGRGYERKHYIVDQSLGTLVLADAPPAPLPTPRPTELQVGLMNFKNSVSVARGGSPDLQLSKGLVLSSSTESDQRTALVTSDGENGILSPGDDAIAYVSQGIAMVRPLFHLPKETFIQARNAAKRSELLSNAKQLGLGLIMLASDMDDRLPGTGENWRNQVSPYLKNDKLFDGFVYSFGGGLMTKIESPATTELGYIPGPGGRAVVYSDGHAKWIPNP